MTNARSVARGVLLGGAIGDALGAIVEFDRDPAVLDAKLGLEPPAALPSTTITDDTQMTLFTAEAIVRTWVRGLTKGIASLTTMSHLAYLRWLRTQSGSGRDEPRDGDGWLLDQPELWSARAPGLTCLASLRSGTAGSIEHRINDSMGCGGVMRTAPIGLVYAPEQAFAFGCGNAALTHGHDNGIAPAGMHARLIALLRGGIGLDEAVQEVVSAADGVPYAVGSAALLRDAAALAQQDFSREQLSGALGEGWVGHEALAIAVACALRHRDDPARAIWAAANHPGDSDSTASIAGQILGAAGGIDALPAGWLDALELRAAAVRLADLLAELRPGNVAADELWPDFPGY